MEQSSNGWQLSGDAKAKVGGVLGRLADLGIEGAGQYASSSSRGVLQKDLADLIKNGNDCRLRVFDVLSQRLLAPASATSSQTTAAAPVQPDQVFVVAHGTVLRQTPNPYGAPVEELPAGAQVVLLAQAPRNDGWRRIRTQNTKADGYINLSDLMRVSP